jgi:hypothetical protein
MSKSYSFVFVCHSGYIEEESLLLAASLGWFAKCEHEIICVIPTPREVFGCPKQSTLDFFEQLGIKIVEIENPLARGAKHLFTGKLKTYLFTNKIIALKAPAKCDKLVFMDNDIVLTKPFFDDPYFSHPFAACPVGIKGATYSADKWINLYQLMNLKIPKEKFKITNQIDNKNFPEELFIPPYFQGGFITIDKDLKEKFSNTWINIFLKIVKFLKGNAKIHAEQMALALTVQRLKLSYKVIPQEKIFIHGHKKQKSKYKFLVEKYPQIKTLTLLANYFETDKGNQWDNAHNYTKIYEDLFLEFKNKEFNLLEIGLNRKKQIHCPSLLMWASWFEKAKIYGFDIRKFVTEHPRIRIFQGDQSNKEDLLNVAKKVGTFDIIIDDGSHLRSDQQISIDTLFPFLNKKGLYVIEDIHIDSKNMIKDKKCDIFNKKLAVFKKA